MEGSTNHSFIVGIVCILLLCFGKVVECLNCVQCSSIVDRYCLGQDVQAKECDFNITYCIKYEGILASNKRLVVRDCSTESYGSICKRIKLDSSPVKVCYHTCTEDGCNHASVTSSTMHVLLLSFFTLCIVRRVVHM